MDAQIEDLLHRGREKNRGAAGLENMVALVGRRRAFGNMVIAGHRDHAAPGRGAGHVGVFEHVAATVYARSFAVPDAEHTIKPVAGGRCKAELLRAPQGGGRQLFVDAWLKNDVVRLQVLLRLDQRLVITAQRRAAVAADKTRRILARLLITQTLQHGQLDQCLDAAHESAPVIE